MNIPVLITYRDLQNELAIYKANDLSKIRLNSAKTVLEREYRRLRKTDENVAVKPSKPLESLKNKRDELIAEYNDLANSSGKTQDLSALDVLWDLRKKVDLKIKEVDSQIQQIENVAKPSLVISQKTIDLTTYSAVRQERLIKALKLDAENHDEELNITKLIVATKDKLTKLWTFYYLNSENIKKKYDISNRTLERLIENIKTEEMPIYPDWVANAYQEFESQITVPSNWVKHIEKLGADIKITLISPNKQANIVRFNRYLNVTDAQIANGYVTLNGETKHIGSVFKAIQTIIKQQTLQTK